MNLKWGECTAVTETFSLKHISNVVFLLRGTEVMMANLDKLNNYHHC